MFTIIKSKILKKIEYVTFYTMKILEFEFKYYNVYP